MKFKDIIGAVIGGSIIYIAMAACTATTVSEDNSYTSGSGGGLQTTKDSGLIDSYQNDTFIDSFVDALTDPVTDVAADTSTGGSRIKIKYMVGNDGSKLSTGFYDSQLKVDCYPQLASDGTTRCLPSAIGLQRVYSNSSCSGEQTFGYSIAIGSCPINPYKYGRLMDENVCSQSSSIYNMGMETTDKYYVLAGTSCIDISTIPGYKFFKATNEVLPASFVKMQLEIE